VFFNLLSLLLKPFIDSDLVTWCDRWNQAFNVAVRAEWPGAVPRCTSLPAGALLPLAGPAPLRESAPLRGGRGSFLLSTPEGGARPPRAPPAAPGSPVTAPTGAPLEPRSSPGVSAAVHHSALPRGSSSERACPLPFSPLAPPFFCPPHNLQPPPEEAASGEAEAWGPGVEEADLSALLPGPGCHSWGRPLSPAPPSCFKTPEVCPPS